ncbi:type II toxin-antitoxin system RelE/ParE family toxin [Devosia sp. SL43]|nr:type II toxin-antitoxin system RelE/ParE family toxin [Devosia sp. SL43]UJW87523.1 type II toxin-antitoxin system RelE/ParE family toxin [Devosia sp. SL43]
MEIIWSPEAQGEVQAIVAYIADFDPVAARDIRLRLEAVVLPLAEHPYLFRSGRVLGTRELVVSPNYIIVYRVTDHVRIVSVLHARQEYPSPRP